MIKFLGDLMNSSYLTLMYEFAWIIREQNSWVSQLHNLLVPVSLHEKQNIPSFGFSQQIVVDESVVKSTGMP